MQEGEPIHESLQEEIENQEFFYDEETQKNISVAIDHYTIEYDFNREEIVFYFSLNKSQDHFPVAVTFLTNPSIIIWNFKSLSKKKREIFENKIRRHPYFIEVSKKYDIEREEVAE